MLKLLGSTATRIRKAVDCRSIELGMRAGTLNAMKWQETDDVEDWPRLCRGLEIEDDLGLVELDLYLYQHNYGDFLGNRTVWVFQDGVGQQHVLTDRRAIPGELERGVIQATRQAWQPARGGRG